VEGRKGARAVINSFMKRKEKKHSKKKKGREREKRGKTSIFPFLRKERGE